MSSSGGIHTDDAAAAAHLKMLKLQQQCTSAVQQLEVLTVERDVLVRCLRSVTKLLSGFLSDVRAALAAKDLTSTSSANTASSSGSAEHCGQESREMLERPTNEISPHLSAFLSYHHGSDGNSEDGVAVAALHATKYLEDVLSSLLPFLLRCVRSSSSSSSSSSGTARVDNGINTTPEACAATPSSSSDAPSSSRRALLESPHSDDRAANEQGRLSDRQIRAVVENIEYDRRMKLVLRMHQEIVLQLLLQQQQQQQQRAVERKGLPTAECWPLKSTTSSGGGRTNRLDETLSPVTIPLTSADVGNAPNAALAHGWELSAPPPFSTRRQHSAESHETGQPREGPALRNPNLLLDQPFVVASGERISAAVARGFSSHQDDSVDVDPPLESANSSLLSTGGDAHVGHHHHRHRDAVETSREQLKKRHATSSRSPASSHSLESVLSELSGSDASRLDPLGTYEDEERQMLPLLPPTEDRCPARSRYHSELAAASPQPPQPDDDESGLFSDASSAVPARAKRQQRLVSFGFDVVGVNEIVDAGSLLVKPILQVVYVHHSTAAERYGICPGDVLFKINERRTTTHDEFLRAVQELNREPSGTPVHLRVLRQGRLLQFFLIPDELPLDPDPASLARKPSTTVPHVSPEGRTPVRRDLLGSYPIAPSHTERTSVSPRRGAHSPPPRVSATLASPSGTRRSDPQEGEHVLYHDADMVGRLNKTLERLKKIQRQREELLSLKDVVGGGHGISTVSISSSGHSVTSRHSTASPVGAAVPVVVHVSHSRQVHSHHLRATSPAFKATCSPSRLSPMRNGANTSAFLSSPTRSSARRRTPSPQEQRPWK